MAHSVSDGFPYYISLTEGWELHTLFNSEENFRLLKSVSEEMSLYRYETGKWSIRQILGHITDHERIMNYRALRFSRKDKTILPGYDQDLYVENSRFDELPYTVLLDDFIRVREVTRNFINMLSPEQLKLKGTAWKFELTVDETLRAIIGHEMHHIRVLKEKYLV